MPAPFLTAAWKRLAIVTWKVPDDLLFPMVPPGCVLDRWEGSALASVLAFEFLDTSVLGIPAVGFRRFPEWNLRFYVRERESGRRGITFVKEMIPSALLTVAARFLYGEPYRAVPYRYERYDDGAGFSATHLVRFAGRQHAIRVETSGTPETPPADSFEHFLSQVPWGFRERGGRRQAYRVEHAAWGVWPWSEITLDARFASVYGSEWAILDATRPVSKFVADGSSVAVFPPQFETAARAPRAAA